MWYPESIEKVSFSLKILHERKRCLKKLKKNSAVHWTVYFDWICIFHWHFSARKKTITNSCFSAGTVKAAGFLVCFFAFLWRIQAVIKAIIFYLFVMMSSKILQNIPDFFRISRIINHVFDNCQHSWCMHSQCRRDKNSIDFYCIEFVKIWQYLWISVKKSLKMKNNMYSSNNDSFRAQFIWECVQRNGPTFLWQTQNQTIELDRNAQW